MTADRALRSGGQVVVDALRIHGTTTVFCVPGESFLPVLDALHGQREFMRVVAARHEAAAGHMAEAHAKLTGRPGVCIVTRGPGATQASIAVHTARQDSTPMVLLVGQVSRRSIGREAWQEIDIPAMFAPIAKWATRVDRADRIPEIMSTAFQVATSGRPGPVVVALPEDLLYEQVAVADTGCWQHVQAHPGQAQLKRLRDMLLAAHRPMVLLGGGGWNAQACENLRSFVERFDLPVATGFRRQDLLDNRHRSFAGDMGIGSNPQLVQRLASSDLVLAIGTRLSETTTADYTRLRAPRPAQTLVHVHADASELGRVYQADLMVHAGMGEFAQALASLAAPETLSWRAWTQTAREDYVAWLTPNAMPGALDLGRAMAHLREVLPADAIVTNGAGNYSGWVHRFWTYGGFRTQLAPASGVMGYGLPAAIAAKLEQPQRTVVCFAGDGCFQMSSPELATARQHGVAVVVIVVNNGIWGSIRMHQEMHYPGRVVATSLENPDFAALARAHGLHGETVERTDDFPAALARALKAPHGALLDLRVDAEAITPTTTLTALRTKALAKAA